MERAVEIEKRLAEQEWYSRTECVELVGLPEDIDSEDLEASILDAFDVARIKLKKWDFHVIHSLRNRTFSKISDNFQPDCEHFNSLLFFIITTVFQQFELWNFVKLSMKDKFTPWKMNKLFSICRSYCFF